MKRTISIAILATAALSGVCRAADDEADLGEGVGLTVYNQNFAVVKERRLMKLAAETSTVKFPNVAATIEPDTVQFSSLKPLGAKVLEQNYEFDLVSADKLLHKYLDQSISIVGRDGGLIEGKLLSSDAANLVLATAKGVDLVPRGRNVKDIRFASLPDGLLTRPTLVWRVRAAEAGEHLVKVAYRARAINWRVDYRAVAASDEKSLDLAGWVTIDNQTGTTFEDAQLKLMAGDVNLIATVTPELLALGDNYYAPQSKAGEGFVEKSFDEYHLYTLGRKTTLKNAQTKQIELIRVDGVPVKKEFLYRPEFGQQVSVALSFKNSDQTIAGLGIPLPKGPVRVYQRDAGGEPDLIGADAIDHTPKDEEVRLRTGFAFDLAADRKQLDNRQPAGAQWNEQDWSVTLRNHKSQAVRIVVEEPLRTNVNWEILKSSHEFVKKNANTIAFEVDLPPDAQAVVTFTVRYSWSGADPNIPLP